MNRRVIGHVLLLAPHTHCEGKHVRRVIPLLAAASAAAVTALTLLPSGAAQAAVPLPQIGGANPCQAVVTGDVATACLTPDTSNISPTNPPTIPPGCSPFAGNEEFQSATDGNGVPIFWTYPNGSNPCVQVLYITRQPTTGACSYYFYVPNRLATSIITPRTENPFDGWSPAASFDENPVSGWQRFVPEENEQILAVGFTDANGRGPTRTEQIGWGQDSGHGIWQVCPRT